jgi:glucose-6-phosphate isomerase
MASASPFRVSLDLAASGPGARSSPAFASALADAERALAELIRAERGLELFSNVARSDDLAAARKLADALKKDTSAIFVLGIGGSSLGGQALKDLAVAVRPEVHFFDNPDPATYERALKTTDLKTTRFIAISKSGGTPETLAQVLIAADALKSVGGGKHLAEHFVAITEPHDSPLRKFATLAGCPVLDHPTGIGGRYSVLTVVGLLPALLMGLDPHALRAGARAVLELARAPESPPALGAAQHFALAQAGQLRESVLWCYADRLKTFGPWWRQLWAESLGKNGKGTTPVAVLGPVDQHSQLQLFLDGPGGALFTLIDCDTQGQGPLMPAEEANRLGLSYLAGRRLGDLIAAEVRATAESLARHGRPVRRITVPTLDERALGALFMHFMLETILMGKLMGVDPFDQPAVEEGKVLARKYLEGQAPKDR